VKREKKSLTAREGEVGPVDLLKAAGVPKDLPESYHVTIIVHPTGNDSVSLLVNMPDIKRSDILADDYPAKGIQAVVKQLELMVWGPAIGPTSAHQTEAPAVREKQNRD
jgi:hypothetical protein